ARQHGGVQPIGLGELAGGFGKPSCLSRVDLDQGKARIRQPALESAVVGTGRLMDDTNSLNALRPAEPADEGLVARLVIGEAATGAITHSVGVEMVFRDVDSDGIKGHLSLVLCLSS